MMKLRYLLAYITVLVLCFSCKNEEQYKDVIFVTGAETDVTAHMTVDGPATFGVSATCTAKLDKDVAVNFTIDNSLVDGYNRKFNRNYKVLPKGCYALATDKSVIPAGYSVSDPIMFDLTSAEDFEEGATYVVPVSITNAEGGIDILESCKTLYIVINKTIITKAAYLNSNYLEVPKFKEHPELKALNAFTMETRIYANNFQPRDPRISSIIGIEDSETFLLRFGDASLDPGQLQLTAGDQITSESPCVTKKWYHVAAVFDGHSTKLYLDGVLLGSKEMSNRKTPVNLYDGGTFRMGYSYNGRYLDGYISETRVWTRVLSAAELTNNKCYVDPASEGLLAYWRFNSSDQTEDGKTVVRDMTGHGYDAIARRAHGDNDWMEAVRCPE